MVEQPGAVPGKLAAASLVVVVNTAPAAYGPKPKIVLHDALANTIEIIEGAHTRLVYDRPLPDEGLTWDALVDWWATETLHETNLHVAGRHLYDRLRQSLEPGPDRLLLWAYAQRRGGSGPSRGRLRRSPRLSSARRRPARVILLRARAVCSGHESRPTAGPW